MNGMVSSGWGGKDTPAAAAPPS